MISKIPKGRLPKSIYCVLALFFFCGSSLMAIEGKAIGSGSNFSLRIGLGAGVNFGGDAGIVGEFLLMRYLGIFAGIGYIWNDTIALSCGMGVYGYPLGTSGDLQPRIGISMGMNYNRELTGLISGGLVWNWSKRMFFSFDMLMSIITHGEKYDDFDYRSLQSEDLDYRSLGKWGVGLGIHIEIL